MAMVRRGVLETVAMKMSGHRGGPFSLLFPESYATIPSGSSGPARLTRSSRALETPRFRIAGYTTCEPLKRRHRKATGSLYPSQWSQGICKVGGVQDLYACVVVAVKRRHCARAPSRDRVCRVGKPYPEVG